MLRVLVSAMILLLTAGGQETAAPSEEAPSTQPSSQPARRSTLRKPKQFELLEPLLTPEPIRPEREANPNPKAKPRTTSESLAEGRMIIEKRGRYVLRDGHPMFEFTLPDADTGMVMFELQRNQLLEVMETAVE